MLNLIKYEFIKKSKLILIALIASLVANIYLFTKGTGGSIIFLSTFPMIASVFYFVDILKMYSEDLNKKSGYMLFMTPNSGYKIIVSKILTAVVEGFALLFLYFIYVLINGFFILYNTGANINFNINEIIVSLNNLLSGSLGFNLGHIFMILITALLVLVGFLTTAYTAMTIRKSIFSEIKFGGALSFVIFLLINWGLSYVSTGILDMLTPYYDFINAAARPTAQELVYIFMPINVLSLIEIVALTFCSGYLLEKKINL